MGQLLYLPFALKGFFSGLYEIIKFLQPIFVAVSTILTIWIVVKSWPKKYSSDLDTSEMLVINWSGHPLPDAEWLKNVKVWNPTSAPHFNTYSWDDLLVSIQKLLTSLPKDISMRILRGDPNIVIVIPQLAIGAAILLASLHGISGGFATITSPLRGKDGKFFLPPPINLNDIRFRFRNNREV